MTRPDLRAPIRGQSNLTAAGSINQDTTIRKEPDQESCSDIRLQLSGDMITVARQMTETTLPTYQSPPRRSDSPAPRRKSIIEEPRLFPGSFSYVEEYTDPRRKDGPLRRIKTAPNHFWSLYTANRCHDIKSYNHSNSTKLPVL